METRAPRWAWTGRLDPRILDWLIVGVLLLGGGISSGAASFTEPAGRPLTTAWLVAIALALTVLQTIPLAWRRTQPSLVLALVAIAFGIKVLLGINTSIASIGLLIAPLVSAGEAVLVLAVYAVVFALASTVITRVRDVV